MNPEFMFRVASGRLGSNGESVIAMVGRVIDLPARQVRAELLPWLAASSIAFLQDSRRILFAVSRIDDQCLMRRRQIP